ncbi:uncharacterized protein METZ01_LOCUS219962, partial [marine metagenome]
MNDQANILSDELNAYDRVSEGTRWPAMLTHVDGERQERYHQILAVDGAIFGTLADVSIFTQDVSRTIAKAGFPNDGRILLSQRIFQTGYVRLGEELSVEAEVGPDSDGPRGRYLTCNIGFRRTNRAVALRMVTRYLLPFAKVPDLPRTTTTPLDPAQGMEVVGCLELTPENVTKFAQEAGNLIHSDPEYAHARGFRAPIAQGLMQLTAMHSAVVKQAMPWEMDLQTRF